MSRTALRLFMAGGLYVWQPSAAAAQVVGPVLEEPPARAANRESTDQPADPMAQQRLTDDPDDLPSCADIPPDNDTIVICRILVDPDDVMLPGPKSVDGDAGMPRAPAMTEPPCWVTKDKMVCLRFGNVPPWPPMVDTTKFPEPLSAEDAARVFAGVPDENAAAPQITGKRVAIPMED